MDIYYLNDCGIIRKANFIADLSYESGGFVLTEELLYAHRTRIPCTQKRKYSYKIINTDNGRIVAQWEIEENYNCCINEDEFNKKHKEYFHELIKDKEEYFKKLVREKGLIELYNRAYNETLRKLFRQKLEEYIKEQWKMNSMISRK